MLFKVRKSFLKLLLGVLLFSIVFNSCKVTQNTGSNTFFKNLTKDTTIQSYLVQDPYIVIKKGDILKIEVSSLSKVDDEIFNLTTTTGISNNQNDGYLVENDGQIQFHKIGWIKAEGLSYKQLSEAIKAKLLPYLKDPVVLVRSVSNRVIVLGQVAAPQVITLAADNKISLPEVISRVGGLSEYANPKEVVVIKNVNGNKNFYHVNMEDVNFFSSPNFMLGPDDIVYVKSDSKKLSQQDRLVRQQRNLTYTLSGISLFILILDRITRK